MKERKTGSSWEDSLKRKKSGEQNRGTGRERERGAGKEGLKKDFQQKGFSGFSRCESESIFDWFVSCINWAIIHFVFFILVLELFLSLFYLSLMPEIMLFTSVNSTHLGHGCRLKMGLSIHNQSCPEILALFQKNQKMGFSTVKVSSKGWSKNK